MHLKPSISLSLKGKEKLRSLFHRGHFQIETNISMPNKADMRPVTFGCFSIKEDAEYRRTTSPVRRVDQYECLSQTENLWTLIPDLHKALVPTRLHWKKLHSLCITFISWLLPGCPAFFNYLFALL